MNLLESIEQKDLILDYVDKRLYNLCNAQEDHFPHNSPYYSDPDFRDRVNTIYKYLSYMEEPEYIKALGIDKWFDYDKSKIEVILTNSPHRYLSMYITYYLWNEKVTQMRQLGYLPAQDYLFLLIWDKEQNLPIAYPYPCPAGPDEYVRIVLQAFNRIDYHLQEGREKGLSLDLVILHDELCGTILDHFDPQILSIAKEFLDFINLNTDIDRSNRVDEKGELNEDFKAECLRLMDLCSVKITEIGKKYFPDGRLEEGELSYNYLLAHAEGVIVYGNNWREEEDAL